MYINIMLCNVLVFYTSFLFFVFLSLHICFLLKDDNNSEYPLSSDEIEKKYVCDRQQQIDFVHQGKSYFINFKEMFQMNGKKRALIRRPVFFKEKNAM